MRASYCGRISSMGYSSKIRGPKRAKHKVKVKWVPSWHSIPFAKSTLERDKSPLSSTIGYFDNRSNTIYAIKGKTPESYIEHEKYHAMEGHADLPKTFDRHLKDELEATKYAYDKTGNPKHILCVLRANFNDGIKYIYRVKPHEAIISIKRTLNEVDAPQAWLDDYELLFKEYKGIYG